MFRSRLSRLLVLNGVLAAVLLVKSSTPPATAQPGQTRARGEYTMVAGKTNFGGPHAIYILDGVNQELVALRWDQSKQTMIGIGYRNLVSDAAAPSGR